MHVSILLYKEIKLSRFGFIYMEEQKANIYNLPELQDGEVLITKINPKGIQKILKAQQRLIDFVENLNEYVEKLLERRQIILKGRYYHITRQLEDTKRALELYKKTLKELEDRLNEAPNMKNLTKEITFYKEYSELLLAQKTDMEERIQKTKEYIKELNSVVKEKKAKLREQNRENLKIAQQITKLKAALNSGFSTSLPRLPPIETVRSTIDSSRQLTKEILKTSRSRASGSVDMSRRSLKSLRYTEDSILNKTIEPKVIELKDTATVPYEEYEELQKKLQQLMRRNFKLKNHILTKFSNFHSVYDLLIDSFHHYESLLVRSQQRGHEEGMKGSLIFLLMNSKKKTLDSFEPITVKDTKRLEKRKYDKVIKPYYKHSEGEAVDVMYRVIKQLQGEKEKKPDKREELLKGIRVEHLSTFNALQLMGLVLLKPEIIRDILTEFDIKNRKLGFLMAEVKSIKTTPNF